MDAMATVGEDRVLAPLGRRKAPVSWRADYGPYLVFGCTDADGPRPRAGQFYMLSTARGWGGGEGERPFLGRAFSVLRAPAGSQELDFLLERVGPGTGRLAELDVGEELCLVGPFGNGFKPPSEDRTALLVGGGVGIAPLAILQDQLVPNATPLLGFRDAPRASGAELLADARICTDDGSIGHHGYVTELLERELAKPARLHVYACGPEPMLDTVARLCSAHDTPAQLALESGMACGFGACFGCVVPTKNGYLRLCLDGPVLDARAIA